MTAKELLDRLELLFQKPESWTTGAFAKTKQGFLTEPDRENAVCWCISGGVRKLVAIGICDPSSTFIEVSRLLDRAALARGWSDMIAFNDAPDTTHADIIDLIREAKEFFQAEKVGELVWLPKS